jgi:hypothetical protein
MNLFMLKYVLKSFLFLLNIFSFLRSMINPNPQDLSNGILYSFIYSKTNATCDVCLFSNLKVRKVCP